MSAAGAIPLTTDFDWAEKKKVLFSGLVFCAILALFVRGLFEITIGKLLGYGVQVGLWSLVQFIAITMFRCRATNLLSFGAVLTFFFGIVAVISSFITLHTSGFSGGIITTLVNIYLLLLFVAGYGFQTQAFQARPIALSMGVAGFLLPAVSLYQLLATYSMPGDSPGRYASLTGSYLHLPLLLGVLGIALLECAKALRWWVLYPVSLFCFMGVGMSGGRSGTFVLFGAGALYIILEFLRKSRAVKLKFIFSALIVVIGLGVITAVGFQFSATVQRIFLLGSLTETGNAQRLQIWNEIYQYWLDTNLWFGEYTGLVGNATNNLNGTGPTIVAESGALQQLINFGFLGLVSFYGAMLLGYRTIAKECTFLRALFISAMVQTLFYQSTEVLPYMALLAFMPALSQCLRDAGGDRYSNQGR
jgi:hypothetical protein